MTLYDSGSIEEGDPSMIRAEADELKTVAANIHTVAEMLRTVSTKGVWDSCAGTIFENEVGTTPEDLFAIANRLSDTERIIRPYADRLETSQAALKRLRTRYDENVITSDERKATLDTLTPEDPEYVTVDREYRAAANSREMNKRGYTSEVDSAIADERAMATSLARVGFELSDTKGYNAFEMSSRTGTSRLFNNPVVDFTPWGKPAAVMKVGDPVGKLGRRAVYGEGSYSDVATTTVLTAAEIVVPVSKRVKMKNASRASRRAEELRGIKASTKSTNPIAHRRWAADGRSWAQHKVATSRVKAKHRTMDRMANKSGVRLVDDMVTDWAAVAGSGRVRKGGYAVKYSVKVHNKATSQVNSVQSTKDTIDKATASTPEKQAVKEREEAAERRRSAEQRQRDGRIHDLTSDRVVSPVP